MKLIKPSVCIKEQDKGLEGVLKQIEWVGRHCYMSMDKITDTSAKEFVNRLIKNKHLAMLEHGTVYLECRIYLKEKDNTPLSKYINNKYSKCYEYYFPGSLSKGTFVTTNLRVLQENGWLGDLQYLCEPTEFHERRITLKFITSIGIVRELLRHRHFSFANESTRYCNYSRDKFDNELTFIIPSWLNVNAGHIYLTQETWHTDNVLVEDKPGYIWFMESCAFVEKHYINMLKEGLQPQQAREVLPLCTKSELVMTGFESDWKDFFDKRLKGTTGKPHPDMIRLCELAQEELTKNGIVL